jgi:hypothetical protein
MNRPHASRLAAWLLAGALLLVTTGASAHDLDHQFQRHDGACALHFFSQHDTGVLPPIALVVVPVRVAAERLPYFSPTRATSTGSPYGARAPPALSDV